MDNRLLVGRIWQEINHGTALVKAFHIATAEKCFCSNYIEFFPSSAFPNDNFLSLNTRTFVSNTCTLLHNVELTWDAISKCPESSSLETNCPRKKPAKSAPQIFECLLCNTKSVTQLYSAQCWDWAESATFLPYCWALRSLLTGLENALMASAKRSGPTLGPISSCCRIERGVCVCVVILISGCQASEVPLLSLCMGMSPFLSLDPITVDV